MTAGRRPLPDWAKKVKGTARPGRMNQAAPEPEKVKPSPPRGLEPAAKKIFRELVKQIDRQGYASKSHARMLGLAAMRLAEVDLFTDTLIEKGYTYETVGSKGQKVIKSRPEVAMRSDASRHAQTLLAEFGLSPSSMSKVKVPGKKKEKSTWEAFGA